ncbi:MAG TPA: sigma-70 family RNA polymerase sigma factor [Gemmataceae bacterium]|nr:sigma-70 family RNA polymerase sigma factor [Gemmataceae bacterium]
MKVDQDQHFAALYDEYGSLLFRVGRALLGSGADAEDAVQSVFLSLVRSRKSLSGIADIRAYLLSALRHAAARIASRRTKESRLGQQAARSTLESALSLRQDDAFDLEKALRSLPPDQREIIALKFDGGLTFAEIATLLNINPNTAASRYRYALEKLRAALQ